MSSKLIWTRRVNGVGWQCSCGGGRWVYIRSHKSKHRPWLLELHGADGISGYTTMRLWTMKEAKAVAAALIDLREGTT